MTEEYISKSEHLAFKEGIDKENARQNERLNKLEVTVERINDLAVATNKLASTMESMLQEQKEQGQRLRVLEGKDGKKWQETVKILASAVIGALVTFIAQMVLK